MAWRPIPQNFCTRPRQEAPKHYGYGFVYSYGYARVISRTFFESLCLGAFLFAILSLLRVSQAKRLPYPQPRSRTHIRYAATTSTHPSPHQKFPSTEIRKTTLAMDVVAFFRSLHGFRYKGRKLLTGTDGIRYTWLADLK